MNRCCLFHLLTGCLALASLINVGSADGPADNLADKVRPIPPLGIEIPAEQKQELLAKCAAVRELWQQLQQPAAPSQTGPRAKSAANTARLDRLRSLAPEVLVFPRAVELAIEFQQFYKPAEFAQAIDLLDEAIRRIEVIKQGGSWAEVVGLGTGQSQQLIVGGYQSKIDGSFQPYSVVIPPGMTKGDVRPRRLDLWFHGRGETLSEVSFLHKQQNAAGQYTPADTFVLHPYGRYSNAFKFAGEIDVLEGLDYLQGRLPVDPTRISVRGFSMGGAGCWQFATHYADRFFAANPGAGFSETPEFLSFFQGENARQQDPPYQQTLWQLYDCPPWAINLAQCPTVAYSGEVDRQKQAADVMEAALDDLGIDMIHVIGPETAHKIHPQAKVEIEQRMASLARSATAALPNHVHFATVSLRYHRMHWVDVRGLQAHWSPASVDAKIEADDRITVKTNGVTSLRLSFGAGQWPGTARGPIHVDIDGTKLVGPNVSSDRSWEFTVSRTGRSWQPAVAIDGLRKRPGLQGPIDDALMDSFVFVLPNTQSGDPAVQAWIEAESQHAMLHWRKHFRGDIRSIKETELTDEIAATANLIVFGDPRAGGLAGKIAKQLPITWDQDLIRLGDDQVDAAGHVAVLIYPNPLNPTRYVVLNSGFTFREYDYLNNARQTPKLPDWALIDVREGATTRLPGKVEAAGFFDEQWRP
jgi:pimeloyl-ACP methyl ester carboxylesterase